MRDALIGFLAGIIAAVAVRMSWEDEDIRETEGESLGRFYVSKSVELPVPVYTCDQFWADEFTPDELTPPAEPTPSEMLATDTELCYGFSTTPKGAPFS